ncbi:MAG TPA: exodeoxyribonuclease V subunit alpha [Luteimonas sp.]|nr:exodeoxyribonuclease V subunit alpha [Luteimonas sp.]
MSVFDALRRSGLLRPIDQALAQSLQRLDADTPDMVLAGAALASLAVSEGHAAFDPAGAAAIAPWPAPRDWPAAFAASRWVAQPGPENAGPNAPLVFEHGLLYLRRYREYERRLAAGLRRIAAADATPGELAPLAPLFAQLFPGAADDGGQARAAALALVRKLLLLTGGPGTGKTTTLARLLALLVARQLAPGAAPPRVALAAPTGRAAERMAHSMAKAIEAMRRQGIDPRILDALPTQARTLHRLLGTIPDQPRFRHDARHPLPYDIVVVDEASMVDLPLMCKLVDAVADGAALVLVGDPDQLPSVEAGDVLAAIVQAAGDGDVLADDVEVPLAPLLGRTPTGDLFADASSAAQRPPLAGHRVHLRRGWRQSSALELAPLADAVRAGDSDRALALLRAQSLRGVHFHADLHDPLAAPTRDRLLAPWRELAAVDDPAQALAIAARVRLLTALRDGPQGAIELNARIEDALAGAQRERYFHGRLLLVSENSYRHGLFNGDIGVCLRDPDGAIVAWFAGGDGLRAFHPAALPAHEGAFAMTVHKAQGSEFDVAWLLLPRHDARTLSRELLYTAITRARDALHLCASEDTLRATLARRVLRVSGLRQRLLAPRAADVDRGVGAD